MTLALRRVLVAALTLALAVLTLSACTGAATPGSPAASPPPDGIVGAWSAAWNGNRPADMAALFTPDGTYTDLAFQATWKGSPQIATWVSMTHQGIAAPRVEVRDAFRDGDRIGVVWTFSGHVMGAPAPFSVPVSTIMRLEGDKIADNQDFYNVASVLRQSGLPADWTPPTE